MKPEFPKIDQDKMVSPHAQEIEYALILSRMINSLKNDPAQMRLTVYEFARARLQIDTSWAEGSERNRLLAALETAIEGVEAFSVRREEKDRDQAKIGSGGAAAAPQSTYLATVSAMTPAQQDVVAHRTHLRPEVQTVLEIRARTFASTLAPYCIGALLLGTLACVVYYREVFPSLREALNFSAPSAPTISRPIVPPSVEVTGRQGQATDGAKDAVASSNSLSFPVPSDYGVYALTDGTLSELSRLPEQVPDKRIAMSTPVNQPSRTIIPDGKARFILFRRDLAGNAPERIDVRVVAQVVRALTFDSKGKPRLSPVSDAWNIRNLSYEFRVRPIAGNPEMLMVQSENPDFTLPAGRYVLALRDQGYDFTVSGKVTEPAHCLERTDAANGAFYSECQQP
jgi:hypothetical protein